MNRKSKIGKIAGILAAAVMSSVLTACGGAGVTAATSAATLSQEALAAATADQPVVNEVQQELIDQWGGKVYKLGALQLVQHPALDLAYQGYIDGLEENGLVQGKTLDVDVQNAGGDKSVCQTIASKFVNSGVDFIFAVATDSIQAVANATKDIPSFFTAVTDPVAAGVVNSIEKPGGNVTGTSDANPIEMQAGLIKTLVPDAKRIGFLYSSNEINSKVQVDAFKEAIAGQYDEVVDYTVAQTGDIQRTVESMNGKIDVLYIPTDNMMASNMATISMLLNQFKIASVVGEESMVDQGGLATFSIDYYKLGKQTAEMTVRALKGESVADMPVETQNEYKFRYNEQTAGELGITVDEAAITAANNANTANS